MKTVCLASMADVTMGSAPPGHSYNSERIGLPLIAGAGDYGETHPAPSKWTTSPTTTAMRDDLIVCVRATIGNLNWADREYCLGRGVAGIKARPGNSLKYLAHYIDSHKHLLARNATGSTFLAIRRSHLEELPVPKLPLPEQKRIAAILDKADAVRRNRAQTLELADQFLKSAFLDMFGDPVTNPKGWAVRRLADFYVDSQQGTKCGPFGGALKRGEYTAYGVAVWNMDNISQKGRLNPEIGLWISEDKYEQLMSYHVQGGDIIISRAGTVGKMCVVEAAPEKSIINTNLIRLRLGDNLLPVYFVSLMTYCKGRVGNLRTGSDGSFTHMNTGVLDKLTIPWPPVELQRQYAELRASAIALESRKNQALEASNSLFNSLTQRAFRGDL